MHKDATNTQPRTPAERNARLAKIAARPDAPAGVRLIEVREPSRREREFARGLEPMARAALARKKRAVA